PPTTNSPIPTIRPASTRPASKPFPQIHPRIKRPHLLPVAVEGPGRNPVGEQPVPGAGDAALGLLAPARMVHVRIDVAVEAILLGLQAIPRGRRHALGKADLHDRLGALEAVLPWHH